MIACREGWIEVVRVLLIFGSNKEHVNKQGDSAIILASRENNIDIVRLLIVDGSNINCCNKVFLIFRHMHHNAAVRLVALYYCNFVSVYSVRRYTAYCVV
jgi:ankyrin repeat protein